MSEFAGSLRERIAIERQTNERSAEGLSLAGWSLLAECWAAISPDGSGAEKEGMSLSLMPRFRIVIRRRAGVAVDQRVVWRGRTIIVRQVVDDPRERERLLLRCEETR